MVDTLFAAIILLTIIVIGQRIYYRYRLHKSEAEMRKLRTLHTFAEERLRDSAADWRALVKEKE